MNKKQVKKNESLKIIPLGGCEEVGKNMTIFEYKKDILILDMGLQFPEEDMPGIDYVIPNTEYLKGKEKNIQGVIFSHGHLDHIGAAPILLKKLGNPFIIGRPLTIEMIKHRQEDLNKGSSKNLKTIYIDDIQKKMNLGPFTVSFFKIDHSIVDAVGTIIETPVATVIHPGDWMIEHKPKGRGEIEYNHLAKLKRPTVLMLESLGSTSSKKPVTEEEMFKNLYNLIDSAPGRIIISTFSSQILRIKEILDYASKIGKKVALDGFSMKLNIEIAKKLGYIKVKKDVIIPTEKIKDFPDNKIIVICTGAQGEEMSALFRIANGNHRFIKVKKSDTIVFSSSVIPGNERAIQRLKDNLYRLSDHVFHSDIMDVHSSGHSNIEDIKNIISQIKPDYFIPVYANHFMLKEAAKIAYSMGFPENKVFVPDNGSIIQFDKKGAEMLKEKVPANHIFVDGLGIGDVGEIVLRDRQTLAKDGMFVIVAVVDKNSGKICNSPDIISRGFIYLRESKGLLAETRKKTASIVNEAAGSGKAVNWNYIKNEIREKLGNFLYAKTQRRPIILPVVIEV
jgi:ribonuclease J